MRADRPVDVLSACWLAALALPVEQIDCSHLADSTTDINTLAEIHECLWPDSLKIGHDDLTAMPGLADFLALPRVRMVRSLGVFGLLLLAPEIRKMINGQQLRMAYQSFDEPIRHWVEATARNDTLIPLVGATRTNPGGLNIADIQNNAPITWNSVSYLGADAALIVATAWLRSRLHPDQAAIWALIRLRLPKPVLSVAESGKLTFDVALRAIAPSESSVSKRTPEVMCFLALVRQFEREVLGTDGAINVV